MVFGLLAIVESFMVFDMVVHGLKDFNRLCISRQCIDRTHLSSLHRTDLSNTYYLLSVSSIILDSVLIVLKEISVSHSKNVVTRSKDKDRVSVYNGICDADYWGNYQNQYIKIRKFLIIIKYFKNYFDLKPFGILTITSINIFAYDYLNTLSLFVNIEIYFNFIIFICDVNIYPCCHSTYTINPFFIWIFKS